MDDETKRLEEAGLISRSLSNWSAPCMVEPKKQDSDKPNEIHQALALDSQFWVIVTVKPTTMYITCLTKTFYIELQHPLDIIFLEESCEASTPSMLLPSCTTLSKEVSQTKLGF